MLLKDVRNNDVLVADHAWVRGRDARFFDASALDEDVVFDAGVACYRKRGGRRDWHLVDVRACGAASTFDTIVFEEPWGDDDVI